MPTAPLVSVVIPTYNAPQLLLETLSTVLAQTLTDFEVIVVDDGSTDDTVAQLQPLVRSHGEQLRVVPQTNGGVGVARNRGIAEATGKYIAFMDHDDWWKPTKLAEQVDFLDSHPSCVAATVPYAESNTPEERVFDKHAMADAQGIVRRPFHQMAAGHMLMKTSSVLMVNRQRTHGLQYGTVRGAIEDTPYQIKLLGRGELGIAGDTILAVWRRHAANFSGQGGYFFKGMKLLRDMQARGEFDGFPPEQARDLSDFLDQQGRVATMCQLPAHRMNGLSLYRSEFRHQLAKLRWKYLLGFPVALGRSLFQGG